MSVDVAPPDAEPEPGWWQSLGRGAPGILLHQIALARAGVAPWSQVQRWAAAMTRQPITAGLDRGLYQGAIAVAYALHTAGQPAYADAIAALDTHIATLTRERLRLANERIEHGYRPALREFDLISGLTGIGLYLLLRHKDAPLMRDVLSYLVRLTHPLRHDGQTVPGWWTDNGPDDKPSATWPGGHGHVGIAHGITGPLALLSTAMRRGVTVAGQAEAIERISCWLDQWQTSTDAGRWWPATVSRSEHHDQTIRHPGPQRPSWCYGTPGVTRAQQLAGLALDDIRRQRRAEHALAACLTDNRQLDQLTDASLCHGWTGLIHTTRRVAFDASNSTLAAQLPRLRARLAEHLDQHGIPDHDGLLEGATGIQFALEDLPEPSAMSWDACLLSG